MENTATAGFNTKGDAEIMVPFDEDDGGGGRVLVREGQGVVDANLSPWDHKQKILVKNLEGTIMHKKKHSPNKKHGYINAQGEYIRYGLPQANEDRDYSSALD